MVSMTKTQLTKRLNIHKVKIRKLHFFSNYGLVLFQLEALKVLNWVPDLVEEGPISSNFSYLNYQGVSILPKNWT